VNWDQMTGNWKQMTGKVKAEWGKLSDDDLTFIDGKRLQCRALARALWHCQRGGRAPARYLDRGNNGRAGNAPCLIPKSGGRPAKPELA